MSELQLQSAHTLSELDPVEWDILSAGRPFQSYTWFGFGERAMADCTPTYLIVRQNGKPIARAALWLIRDEPLPLPPGIQAGLRFIFRHRPLLICRSPLADTSGMILPEGSLREEAFSLLQSTAQDELHRQRGSFLIFDFLQPDQTSWQHDFRKMTVSDPGTFMDITWPNFESYLESGDKKDRQHYKRSLRQAEEHGLHLTKHRIPKDIKTALTLTHNISRKYSSPPNPWMRGLLENLHTIDSTWLEVRQGSRLVGCGALLRDGNVQLASALGLEQNIPYAYFLLVYATLQEAIEHGMQAARLGSGAYEVKRRLGFKLEDNNHAAIAGASPLSRWIMHLAIS